MVHKKTEYGLQYHKLSSDLRQTIWKENIEFRNLQRKNNLADHYWQYQLLDHICSCDEESENGSDQETGFLHREKTKVRVDDDVDEEGRHFTSSRDIAVQTPDWGISDSCMDGTSQYGTQNVSTGTVTLRDQDKPSRVHEVTENTLTERPSNPIPPRKSVTPATAVQVPTKQAHGPSHLVDSKTRKQFDPSASPECRKKQPLKHHEDKRCRVKSRFDPSPTRTSLKSFYEGPKTQFAAFGWNDQDKDMGDKKTFSVHAPKDQVYSTALHAMDLRHRELEHYLEMERKRKREQHLAEPVNSSSIWMTEYQDKFSKGLRESLQSCSGKHHTAFRKPVVWRYM